MTVVAERSRDSPSPGGAPDPIAPRDPRAPATSTGRAVLARRSAVAVLLALTALLYLWDLAASGWANGFYAAAAQAGATDWKAMLFGSSDAANAISVDKTPAALWVMDVSVRIFGLNPWSLLIPQALQGVAAVALLYAAVRRAAGTAAGLLAATVFALTPVAALMFRFDNPDALLVLALVAAAYCTARAIEPGSSRWWPAAAGAAVGVAFLAKMMQAFLVLPGLAVAYLVAAAVPLGIRLLRSGMALLAMLATGGWYLALVELWPAADRPYVGGSQHDSILELALGYNGLGRLTGDETGGLGNLNFDVGWGRLFGPMMGTHAAWLLPMAVVGLVAGLILRRRAARTDPARAALLAWGLWLVVTGGAFSFAHGILHPYYTVALAPAIGACSGIGAVLLWRARRDPRAAAIATVALAAAVGVTVVLAAVLLTAHPRWLPGLRIVVPVAGLAAAALLVVVARLPRKVARAVAALAVAACLAAPAAFTVATALTPHDGAIPTVGPERSFGGGFGPGFAGGLLDTPTPGPALTAMLAADAGSFAWTAAVVGSNNAAGYQLAARAPVMAVGGFNGTDPAPTLERFQALVGAGRIHYFLRGRTMFGGPRFGAGGHGGSRAASDVSDWVAAHFRPRRVDGVVVYDLTDPLPAGAAAPVGGHS